MEEEIRALLLGATAITNHVENSVNFVTHPDNESLPGIVLQRIDGGSEYTLTGQSSLKSSRIQIDCYASTYAVAKVLSREVFNTLSGFKNDMFKGVFHVSSREGREVGTNSADRPYRVSLDFNVHHNF